MFSPELHKKCLANFWQGFIGGGFATVLMTLGLAYIMCQAGGPWHFALYQHSPSIQRIICIANEKVKAAAILLLY
jgi:hypothetical protein